jgi:hypothetical protein
MSWSVQRDCLTNPRQEHGYGFQGGRGQVPGLVQGRLAQPAMNLVRELPNRSTPRLVRLISEPRRSLAHGIGGRLCGARARRAGPGRQVVEAGEVVEEVVDRLKSPCRGVVQEGVDPAL